MADPHPNPFIEMFNDPDRAAHYHEGPAKFLPGFADMHRMVMVLLREQVPNTGTVLVHGAGGGLELDAFARANDEWRFLAVDPAEAMIEEAKKRLDYAKARIAFHCGFIDDAPVDRFDAATSLLTLHFLATEERVRTLQEIVRRLKPGAPFIAVHCSFPQSPQERSLWLDRYQQFAILAGADPEMAHTARDGVSNSIPLFEPSRDAELLQKAGLLDVSMFYAAFTWRGWVGYAP